MRLRLGIAEIDSYNMLFYGHYLRHSERAANSCLGRESTSATVSHVALAKYVSSVSWNDVVDIRTTAHPSEDGTLLHEWFVNERYDTPVHVCLCSYDVDGPAGFVGARTPDGKEARRVNPRQPWDLLGTLSEPSAQARRLIALQREGAAVFTPQDGAGRSEAFGVYPDMVGPNGALAVPCVMDLFERQRTVLIGGQERAAPATSPPPSPPLSAQPAAALAAAALAADLTRPRPGGARAAQARGGYLHRRLPHPAAAAAAGDRRATARGGRGEHRVHGAGRRPLLLRQAECGASAIGPAVRGGLPEACLCAGRRRRQGAARNPPPLRRQEYDRS